MSNEYRDLGMRRRIARRDFLNGIALAVGSGVAARTMALDAFGWRAQPQPAGAQPLYPPAATGLRGNYPAAIDAFAPIQRGAYRNGSALDVDTQERYDLVIVGGGISGLAAAYFWRKALGPEQRVLVLDNHDDFGGHAKRNEFQYNGRTFIGYGGTQSIATLNGATFMGREARIGSIAAGKQADLVVVTGDPSNAIADIRRVETVFKNGVGYDPQKLVASVRGQVGIW